MDVTIKVEVQGNGRFAGFETNLASYSVVEDSTPIDPADETGGTGTIQFSTIEDPAARGSILLLNDSITLTDSVSGRTSGFVTGLSANGPVLTVSADGRLSLLNATGYVAPYKGTLETALRNILARAGITTGITVSPSLASLPVAHKGGQHNYWLLIRQLCQAIGIGEVSLVSDSVVMRPIRQREADEKYASVLSWSAQNATLAQNVEVKYWNYQPVTDGIVFPYGGWTEDTLTVGPVDAGVTQTFNIPVNVSLTSIKQPIVQDFVSRNYNGTDSVYAVAGRDGLPILAAQWTAQGGRLTVAIGEDNQSIDVTVTGAKETQYAPYQIAVSSGPSNYYSALRIVGSGLGFNEQMVTVPTGAPASKAPQEVGVTIDNPWIDTYEQAMDAALRAAGRYAAPERRVTLTATAINRSPAGNGIIYQTFANFDDQWSGQTFADFDADWSGQTFADFSEYQASLVDEDWANQAFGNAAGARLRFRDAYYRIRSATITADGVASASAEADTTFADFETQYTGLTFGEWDAEFAGLAFEDYALIPLMEVIGGS